MPHSQQQTLDEPDLKTAAGRKAAITAAQCLQQAMNSDIDPALLRLGAVQDQRKRFEKWKQKFSMTVSRFLNNLFIHLGNEIGDMPLTSTDLTLPNHSNVHRELAPYTELMHWTKAMDRKTYDGLMTVYTSSLSKIYDRDVRNFFNLVCVGGCTRIMQSYVICTINRPLPRPRCRCLTSYVAPEKI